MLKELKAAITAGEVSQREIALEAGVSPGALSLIMSGNTESPRYHTVELLHAALLRIRAKRERARERAIEAEREAV